MVEFDAVMVEECMVFSRITFDPNEMPAMPCLRDRHEPQSQISNFKSQIVLPFTGLKGYTECQQRRDPQEEDFP